jgi:hypothetical protein
MDDKTVSDIGMQTNSTVTIVMRLLGGQNIEFKVRLHNQEEIKLEAESSCTIANLRKMICCCPRNNLGEDNMSLYFAGIKLTNDRTL